MAINTIEIKEIGSNKDICIENILYEYENEEPNEKYKQLYYNKVVEVEYLKKKVHKIQTQTLSAAGIILVLVMYIATRNI